MAGKRGQSCWTDTATRRVVERLQAARVAGDRRSRMKSTLLSVLLAAVSLTGAAHAADGSKTAHPLKIGIIGTGDIGGALARHWARAGHQLIISSRHPEQLQSLATELGPNVKTG